MTICEKPDSTTYDAEVAARQNELRSRQDLERALRAAEMRTLQMITEGASLTDVLNHVCTSIDRQISPSVTSILLMDPDGKRLWPSAGHTTGLGR